MMNHIWLTKAANSSIYLLMYHLIQTSIYQLLLFFIFFLWALVFGFRWSLDAILTRIFTLLDILWKHCHLRHVKALQMTQWAAVQPRIEKSFDSSFIYSLLLILKQDDTLIKTPIKAWKPGFSLTHRCLSGKKKHCNILPEISSHLCGLEP